MTSEPFIINVNENFPHLNNAPIVEAVVAINAIALREWEPVLICGEVKKAVSPGYPNISEQRQFQGQVSFGKEAEPKSSVTYLGCSGLRAIANDGKYIAQFNKDSFVFSRLTPYEDWNKFLSEAFRLWNIHREIIRPSLIQRIGVRFINRIEFRDQLKEYLVKIPKKHQKI